MLNTKVTYLSFSSRDIDFRCQLQNDEYVFTTIIETEDGCISSVEKFPVAIINNLAHDIVSRIDSMGRDNMVNRFREIMTSL